MTYIWQMTFLQKNRVEADRHNGPEDEEDEAQDNLLSGACFGSLINSMASEDKQSSSFTREQHCQ